jgi:hypothetical protein
MLEDIVEDDDVVAPSGSQCVRKKSDRDVVALARSQSADRRIRLDAMDVVASPCCCVEKPAVRAAYFEQRSPGWLRYRVDPIENPLEILFSQIYQRNLPLSLIDDVGELSIADVRTQVRGEESARGTREAPIVAQRMHGGIANRTCNRRRHGAQRIKASAHDMNTSRSTPPKGSRSTDAWRQRINGRRGETASHLAAGVRAEHSGHQS